MDRPAEAVFRVFLPFAAGYFLSYTFRTVNAVIAPDLSADLGLGAADLGLLTSAYFITFAAFQLPLGVLLDRFGPRRVEALLLLAAVGGALVFALARDLATLTLGRALVGLGVSACLMASFKAFVQWFPPQRLPLLNGLVMAAGGLGALTATAPVEFALGYTDWRGLFLGLAGATLLVAVALFGLVPRGMDQAHSGDTLGAQLSGLLGVLRSRLFWRIAPLTTLSQASFLSIQGLWAGPWLRDVAALQREVVAAHLFWIAAAMVAGFLTLGGLAERLARRGVAPLWVALAGMGLFMVSQSLLLWRPGLPPLAIWLAFGFFGTSGILPYAVLSQNFPRHLAGRSNTSLNLLVFVTAFAAQWGMGAVVNLWPAGSGYAARGYDAAFAMMLLLQLAALLWLAWPRRAVAARLPLG